MRTIQERLQDVSRSLTPGEVPANPPTHLEAARTAQEAAAHIDRLEARVAELEGKLPRTADGVSWHEAGPKVWVYLGGGEITSARRQHDIAWLDGVEHADEAVVPHDECYSTREAAEAAAKEMKNDE